RRRSGAPACRAPAAPGTRAGARTRAPARPRPWAGRAASWRARSRACARPGRRRAPMPRRRARRRARRPTRTGLHGTASRRTRARARAGSPGSSTSWRTCPRRRAGRPRCPRAPAPPAAARSMPRDGADVPLVGARLDDLADLGDGVPDLVVRREVVRAEPDARVGPEVAQDLSLHQLAVDGWELGHVHRHRATAAARVARAAHLEARRVGEVDQELRLPERVLPDA